MNNEKVGNRKGRDHFNYRDWNIKARYKKAHGLHCRDIFPFELWVDYILQCTDYYAELYKIDYNGGYIEIGKKGGVAYVMARKAYGRL